MHKTVQSRVNWFLVVSFFLLIAGCNEYDRGYSDGFDKGTKEAQQEAYYKGYRDGWEKAWPGNPSRLSAFALSVYKALIYGGAIMIILSMGIALIVLIINSDSAQETLGKLLFAILGTSTTILLITYLKISLMLNVILLQPASATLTRQLVWTLFFALLMYGVLYSLITFFKTDQKAITEAWLSFFLACVLTVVIPSVVSLSFDVPDLPKYFASSVFSGALVGGLFYFALAMVRKRLWDETA